MKVRRALSTKPACGSAGRASGCSGVEFYFRPRRHVGQASLGSCRSLKEGLPNHGSFGRTMPVPLGIASGHWHPQHLLPRLCPAWQEGKQRRGSKRRGKALSQLSSPR
jgi:hypothetical protein